MIDLGPIAENGIDDIATNLYKRINQETFRVLGEQLKALGVENIDKISDLCERIDHPDDEFVFCLYHYQGKTILRVRSTEDKMSIVFDIPQLETQGGSECSG